MKSFFFLNVNIIACLLALLATSQVQVEAQILPCAAHHKYQNWMGDMLVEAGFHNGGALPPSTWAQQTLRDILMPGSHDAGTSVMSKKSKAIDSDWVRTQTASVGEQLCHGARYFDIRYKWRPSTGLWYTNHGSTLCESQVSIENDVLTFLTNHPREIVVLRIKASTSVQDVAGGGTRAMPPAPGFPPGSIKSLLNGMQVTFAAHLVQDGGNGAIENQQLHTIYASPGGRLIIMFYNGDVKQHTITQTGVNKVGNGVITAVNVIPFVNVNRIPKPTSNVHYADLTGLTAIGFDAGDNVATGGKIWDYTTSVSGKYSESGLTTEVVLGQYANIMGTGEDPRNPAKIHGTWWTFTGWKNGVRTRGVGDVHMITNYHWKQYPYLLSDFLWVMNQNGKVDSHGAAVNSGGILWFDFWGEYPPTIMPYIITFNLNKFIFLRDIGYGIQHSTGSFDEFGQTIILETSASASVSKSAALAASSSSADEAISIYPTLTAGMTDSEVAQAFDSHWQSLLQQRSRNTQEEQVEMEWRRHHKRHHRRNHAALNPFARLAQVTAGCCVVCSDEDEVDQDPTACCPMCSIDAEVDPDPDTDHCCNVCLDEDIDYGCCDVCEPHQAPGSAPFDDKLTPESDDPTAEDSATTSPPTVASTTATAQTPTTTTPATTANAQPTATANPTPAQNTATGTATANK